MYGVDTKSSLIHLSCLLSPWPSPSDPAGTAQRVSSQMQPALKYDLPVGFYFNPLVTAHLLQA